MLYIPRSNYHLRYDTMIGTVQYERHFLKLRGSPADARKELESTVARRFA